MLTVPLGPTPTRVIVSFGAKPVPNTKTVPLGAIRPGDAVIDGHYGLPQEPAVFRKLRLLRPGDEVQVVWPDGRTVDFEVTSSEIVPASSHPPDVFSRSGPSRLSLITCSGAWDESRATYSDRLIVTAMMS